LFKSPDTIGTFVTGFTFATVATRHGAFARPIWVVAIELRRGFVAGQFYVAGIIVARPPRPGAAPRFVDRITVRIAHVGGFFVARLFGFFFIFTTFLTCKFFQHEIHFVFALFSTRNFWIVVSNKIFDNTTTLNVKFFGGQVTGLVFKFFVFDGGTDRTGRKMNGTVV
jgi:hypothetical protein